MKLKQLALFAVSACLLVTSARSAVIAQWTFETNTPADLNNSVTGPSVAAELNLTGTTATLLGVHASSGTDWSTPSGNGSANSYSVNTWGIGDYFEVQLSTVGFSGLQVFFEQTSSNTGPRDFKIAYSTSGTSFTDYSVYTVLANASPNPVWSGTTNYPAFANSFDFSAITALDNQPTVYFRLINTSTVSVSGTTTVAAAGASRIDNFTVSAIPEPATFGILAAGAAMVALRRRRG